ncbi:virulence RhuM family protein [Inquilinus limosus]
MRLDIRYEGDTLWMSQAQIGQLFGVDRSVITKHIANVYAEGELDAEATSAKIAQVRQEGSRKVERQIEHYNLDVVISVGYRVSSAQATVFRRWATGVLVQFAKKGFVVDAYRLKQPENVDRVAELREIFAIFDRTRPISTASFAEFAPCVRTTTARRKRRANSIKEHKQSWSTRLHRIRQQRSLSKEQTMTQRLWVYKLGQTTRYANRTSRCPKIT